MAQFINKRGKIFEAKGIKFSDWLKTIKPVGISHYVLLQSIIEDLDSKK